MSAPKVFISYSWSSPEHEHRVLDIASQLRESGVDAILDKWDLHEGEEADKFMERMVSDPEICKVLIICDQKYAEKSNKREGGVGTEAQIISQKVFEQQDERKFVVASFELDTVTGKPVVPVYYTSRKYIDFTDSNRYVERFEELVRWIFDKPLYEKPKLGSAPSYILSDESQTLGTSASYHRALYLLKEGRGNAKGSLQDYLETFAKNLGSFQINEITKEKPYYNQVLDSIDAFLPYRNEWVTVLDAVCRYSSIQESLSLYFSFFEEIHPYIKAPVGSTHYYDREEENMKFFEGELFLYFLAILLKYDLLDIAGEVLSHHFYDKTNSYGRGAAMDYSGFYHSIYSFNDKAKAENIRLISYRSKIMYERASNCPFLVDIDVIQADFIAYLRFVLNRGNTDSINCWYPHSLMYASNRRAPFPIFARAVSADYFSRVAGLLNVSGKEELFQKYQVLEANNSLPFWTMNYPSYKLLMNLDHLASI